jgi:hypothetical protein
MVGIFADLYFYDCRANYLFDAISPTSSRSRGYNRSSNCVKLQEDGYLSLIETNRQHVIAMGGLLYDIDRYLAGLSVSKASN